MPDYLEGRERLVTALREELVGPSPRGTEIDCTGDVAFPDRESAYGPFRQAGSGEEILQRDRPIKRYGIGVLYPPETPGENDPEEEAEAGTPAAEEVPGEESQQIVEDHAAASLERIADRHAGGDFEESDFDLSTANSYRPSAVGLSFVCKAPAGSALAVTVEAGRYRQKQVTIRTDDRKESEGSSGDAAPQHQTRRWWLRSPVSLRARFDAADLTSGEERAVPPAGDPETGNLDGLDLALTAYARPRDDGTSLVTVSLVNRSGADPVDAGCLFQVRFTARVEGGEGGGILPYEQVRTAGAAQDPEEASLELLYRSSRTFAVGHGCAADWQVESEELASEVSGECLPAYEAPSITPDIFDEEGQPITVPIAPLAGLVEGDDGLDSVIALLGRYESWIEEQRQRISGLAPEFQEAATRHATQAEAVLARMHAGLELLRSDSRVRRAFQLANHAMLLQQLRSRRRSARETRYNGDTQRIEVIEPLEVPDWRKVSDRGDWRPFQIAFVLTALGSTASAGSPERDTVELIFFPTGGGKTEAYLCLAAFSMFYRRLTDPEDTGVDVLMRYTLRLLTAQQFQRAGALICAMEYLRKAEGDLGGNRFTIGIWVGGAVTPNDRSEARAVLRKLNRGDSYAENKFVVLRCPWCAAQMGEIKSTGRRQRNAPRVAGYEERDRTVVLCCPDQDCDFAGGLPIHVIDEDIYSDPPTLVIGTIDKFAMLAWRPEARALFGIASDGSRCSSPPNLVIQDELHLISGPLGSLAGLYEPLIDELCTDRRNGRNRQPKLVTSTATIRRSEQQILGLYGRQESVLFPPRGLDADDSFFARYARDSDGALKPGRLYAGVHGPGLGSLQTAQVRTFAALLQAPAGLDREEQDPWWTLAVFFNSLRELGTSLSLLQSDIPDYLKVLRNRLGLRPEDVRRLWNILELTGRLRNDEIPKAMEELEVPTSGSRRAVDICLASSIVEVGIDIDRLSLMAVVGQPKTTSQYIQVTGRIGRKWWERPGLVATIYSASKPRDRSHFEKFRTYHERLYAQVEPTSVTPFSPPVLDRALHAVLVAYVRQLGVEGSPPRPVPDDLIAAAEDLLATRVRVVDPAELDNLEQVFQARYGEWRRWRRIEWTLAADGEIPLIRPAGSYATRAAARLSWPVPQSLRNVDAECRAEITTAYLHEDDDV
jgi:Helicase conserved C-terminal domain